MTPPPDPRDEPVVSRALVIVGIGLAAVWSLLRKGYQFDGYFADDQFWNALLMDRLHPGLLAGDPVVALIGERYQSALFEILTLAEPVVGLPAAAFALFAAARLLTCVAIYRLAVTLTHSAGAGLLSAWLVAGASVSYLGGINFVETILTPRGFALPFGLLAIDGFLSGRPVRMAIWLAFCLVIHPVSGANFLGAIAFCGLCFGSAAPRRSFLLSLAALLPVIVLVALWTGTLGAASGPLRFDPEWADIVRDTVGPWVYLGMTPGSVWLTSLWLPVLGAFAVTRVEAPELRAAFPRFAAAALAALVVHGLLVDVLEVRPLLQAAPQRSTAAVASIAVVAVALWLWRSLWAPDPLRRVLASAFLLASLLLADPSLALLIGLALAAASVAPLSRLGRPARAALGLAVVAGLLAGAGAGGAAFTSFRLAPDELARRLGRLRALGVNEAWAAVSQQIRERSAAGDVVMAPAAESPRVFARRPSAMRIKMQSFTHVSRDFAFRYREWRDTIGRPLANANTVRAIELARASGARWLVVDDRATPPTTSDPVPDFRSGPYRAFSLGKPPGDPTD